MTTHIRVSSTCTPTPLVFAFEVFLVLVAGRMKSPGGDCMRLGRYCSVSLEGEPLVGSAEGAIVNDSKVMGYPRSW